MKTGCIALKMAFCFALVMVLGCMVVHAQAISGKGTLVRPGNAAYGSAGAGLGAGGGIVRLRQLTGLGPRYLMQSPDSTGGGSRNALSRSWVALGIQYDSEPEWLDDLAVQFYVLLKARDSAAELTLLKGTVNYVDVARGRGHLGCAYVRPAGLARFGDVIGVAVEILAKGEVASSLSEGKIGPNKPLPLEWWKNPKLVPKEGYIVEKSKTPFALINFDDYEAVK